MHAAGTIAGAGLLNPKARGIAPGEKILLRVNNFAGDTKAKISYDGGRSYEYIYKSGKIVLLYVPAVAEGCKNNARDEDSPERCRGIRAGE